MAPTRIARIGIDLTEFPQKIGGFLLGQYLVVEGSKGLKLTGEAASTTKEEVVEILRDAVDVVKGFFGALFFDAAVIVIPNNTEQKHQDDIISYGRDHGFKITQVIKEHTAVSAFYVEKVQPTISTNIAIISLTGVEISVVAIVPPSLHYDHYHFVLRAHETHPEVLDLDETPNDQKGSGSEILGLMGGSAKALDADPFENVLAGILKILVEKSNIENNKVDKVVFVGMGSSSEKVRKAVKESFSKAEVWEAGIDNPDEIVAYGAAYLSYEDKKIPTMYHSDFPEIPEDPGQAEFPESAPAR